MKQLIEDIIKTNDQSKWSQLIDTIHNDLLAQSYRLIPHGDLHQDALQESCISIYKNLNAFYIKNKKYDDYEFTINFSKWSRTIVRNTSFNTLRHRKNQNKLLELNPNYQEKLNEQIKESKKDSFELKEYLSQMLCSLKQKEHKLLVLKYFEGMTNLEISTETGYQINSIPVLINRALGQLRKRFEHVGLTIAAATLTEVLAQQNVTTSVITTIPPEVFHSIKSIPLKIGILTSSLKGLLMKSLLILITATVLSTSILYLQTNAESEKKTITTKKESTITTNKEALTKSKTTDQKSNSEEIIIPEQTSGNTTSINKQTKIYGLKKPLVSHILPNIQQFSQFFKDTAYGKIWADKKIKEQLSKVNWELIAPELFNMVDIDSTFCTIDEYLFLKTLLSNTDEITIEANKREFSARLKIKNEVEENSLKIKSAIDLLKKSYKLKHDKLAEVKHNITSSDGAVSVSTTSIYQDNIKSLNNLKYKTENNYFYIYIGNLVEIQNKSNENNKELIFRGKTRPSKSFDIGNNDLIRHPFMYTDTSEVTFETKFQNNQFHERSISTNLDKKCLLKPFIKSISEEGFTSDQEKNIYAAANFNLDEFILWAKPVLKIALSISPFMVEQISSQIKENLSGEVFMSLGKDGDITFIKAKSPEKAQAMMTAYSLFATPYGIIVEKGPNNWIKIKTSDKSFTTIEANLKIKGFLAIANYSNKGLINGISKFLYPIAVKYQHAKDYKEMVKPCLPILTQKHYLKYFGQSKISITKKNNVIIVDQTTDIPFLSITSFFNYFETLNQKTPSKKIFKNEGQITITNAKFKQELNYENGKKQGLWKTTDLNGALYRETNYDQGKKSGIRKIFFNNGTLSHAINFKSDSKHGNYKRFYGTGKLKEHGQFKNGKKTGSWKYYHLNTFVSSSGIFSDGHKTGTWEHFDENQKKVMTLNYSKDSSIPMQSIVYHLNGSPKISIDLKDQIHTIEQYNQQSTLIRISHYYNGKKVGHWKEFNHNEKLINEWKYKMEFIQNRRSYYDNGNLKSIINYENSMYDGKQLLYYPNGNIKSSISFSLNSPIPVWKRYSLDGVLKGEWNIDGKFSGTLNEQYVSKQLSIFNIFETFEDQLILISLSGDVSINSSKVISATKLFRGQTISSISKNYGSLLDSDTLKESILYQEYHLNNPSINTFIKEKMGGEKNYFLMNKKVLVKLSTKGKVVTEQDYLEIKNHPLE
ncbi:MAG: hypothetical protein COA79_12360 [Planctomycetota bacterium]|nr:MAG: hypothetical protein COA79_12360 [Planctomycetota bacterium]